MDASGTAAYDLLHPEIQRWVHRQGWPRLHPIQERAIPPVLAADRDVVIAAGTAAGKTEAAFLPILSRLLFNRRETQAPEGLEVLAVSPLKALIDDQFDRLELLGDRVGVAVHRWHGDVSSSAKQRLLRRPSGILLITPESLEALFVRRGPQARALFSTLRYVVVDELHAFLGSERGRQLQSLLHRLEVWNDGGRAIPRIALSATLGDLEQAAAHLRWSPVPDLAPRVLCEDRGAGQDLLLQVRGYVVEPEKATDGAKTRKTPDETQTDDPRDPRHDDHPAVAEQRRRDRAAADRRTVAGHLFETLRGSDALVFANTRQAVESLSTRLREMCAFLRLPEDVHAHHGNLSKALREDAERALKQGDRTAVVVCTSTLELGIDIGHLDATAQVGVPPSVASLRQRLGRSGRTGGPSIMRLYVEEARLDPTANLLDSLRVRLVETLAMVELLVESWVEPPEPAGLHLSTLVQQLLSLLVQVGGTSPERAWRTLCATGPFRAVDQACFASVLRHLATHDLIVQDHAGLLFVGEAGERLVSGHTFFAAFSTPEEFRLVHQGKTLGTLPISWSLSENMDLVFGARRWKVTGVDLEARRIDVVPSRGGRPPVFGGSAGRVHDRVRRRMVEIYGRDDAPAVLDPVGQRLLAEGRHQFRQMELSRRRLVEAGSEVQLLAFRGDRIRDTLALALHQPGSGGRKASPFGPAVVVRGSDRDDVLEALRRLHRDGLPPGPQLAARVDVQETQKHHRFLGPELLAADHASLALDPDAAHRALAEILEAEESTDDP